ncbi:hypothetical protein D3C81_2240140 [compost metagenome]
MNGSIQHSIPRVAPFGDLDLYLIDQDHCVAHDHATQCDDAQYRDETQWRLEHQQCRHHADQAQRRGQHHHPHAGEVLQLQHE